MKENIFEVLMYLFENYLEDEIEALPDSDAIRTELIEAGFDHINIDKAFDWIESLSFHREIEPTVPSSFRIFAHEEITKLDLECRNFIMFLEQAGILSEDKRELVLDRILALENEDISLDKLKWIVLMVLLSQQDDDLAFSRMEDIIYDIVPEYLH